VDGAPECEDSEWSRKFEEPWASLKSTGKRGGADFSPRPRQRTCQDPLTQQGGDALSKHCQPLKKQCLRKTWVLEELDCGIWLDP
jgi:hypothetical protein